jgi:hypothetical protein
VRRFHRPHWVVLSALPGQAPESVADDTKDHAALSTTTSTPALTRPTIEESTENPRRQRFQEPYLRSKERHE